MLLIVGDVQKTKARILYESEKSTENKNINVKLFEGEKVVKNEKITLKRNPQILVFQNLKPNTFYKAIFDETEITTFKTFPLKPLKEKLKLVVVSCDRYFEDRDDSFWKELEENEKDRFGMIHLGDQIYADIITKEFKKNNSLTYDDLLERFREIYRTTWSHPSIKKILRNGFHWMMPDDHEIINNLDEHLVNSPINQVVKAGKQSFIEYQLLLMRDYEGNDDIFFFREIENYGIAMLDFRWKRTFQQEPDSPLLGKKQFNQLKQHVQKWGTSKEINKILIFSQTAGPLLGEQASKLIYWIEKEMYTSHPDILNHTNKMMDIFKPYSSKIKWIVGDLHSFFISKICYDDEYKNCIDHMITSGMTIGSTAANRFPNWLFATYINHLQYTANDHWKIKHIEGYLDKNYGILELGNEFKWKGVFQKEPSMKGKIFQWLFSNTPIILKSLYAFIMIRLIVKHLSG
eukprot:gene9372-1583_t